jgi:hydroxyethylthiazole kinase
MVAAASRDSLLVAVRAAAPRVQCLTNTVAQSITANVLHAVGARASMATHPDEVVGMSTSANAVLINLGTPDAARVAAIARLFEGGALNDTPVVLDPVFVQHSKLRLDIATTVLRHPRLIVKGNAEEIAALTVPDGAVRMVTGPMDRISFADQVCDVSGGHRWMSAVTGMGCALGALIGACAAVEPDRLRATRVAAQLFADAGACAAARSQGPGTFAAAFLDELERLTLSTDER